MLRHIVVAANQPNRRGNFLQVQNLLQPPFVLFEHPVDARKKPQH